MELPRQDPDQLLRAIRNDASTKKSGKLKIFFGYAAGVGKTYAMLQAAHQAKERGIDVVAGYIEPHARPQTMALLDGLEQLPVKQVAYEGMTLREFDIDAALKRNPSSYWWMSWPIPTPKAVGTRSGIRMFRNC